MEAEDKKEQDNDGVTQYTDSVDTNAHYDKSGKITREDFRDEKDSINNWDAEKNRSGRHK